MGRYGLIARGGWAIFCAISLLAPSPARADEHGAREAFASLGTGELNGVYFPVGSAICKLVNHDLRTYRVRCSPEATPGSVYNVRAVQSGELEIGIVQSDVAYNAYHGTGLFAGQPIRELRSVFLLYPELVTIVARPGAGVHDIEGLRGRRVDVGRRGSGARATWNAIQAALGWKGVQETQSTDLETDALPQALCSGEIDAVFEVVGHPSPVVRTQLAHCATHLVAVDGPAIDKLIAASPYFRASRIQGSLYGLNADTTTFGSNTVLMTSVNTDEEVVAAVAKAIVSQISELRNKNPVLGELTLEGMTRGDLPAPLHPAALRVYKELGLLKQQ